MNNLQCMHVVFGCCEGNFHDRVVGPYRNDLHAASRITLLRLLRPSDCSAEMAFEQVALPWTVPSVKQTRSAMASPLPVPPTANTETNDVRCSQPAPYHESHDGNRSGAESEAIANWQASVRAANSTRK